MSEKKKGDGGGHHTHHDGSSSRAFTAEQKAAVLRVRRCQPTDFYDILGLEARRAACSDGEIKKAYRKLSLLTHPDKNGHPGADEAFKMVSRAFQVLSDAEKKAKYDRFGGDPESRFGGGAASSGASPFTGFAQPRGGGGGGATFEAEISPEELFRQFFGGGGGGGMGGMGFGGAPGFVFNLGGGGGAPGIRVHHFGGGQPRRRPHPPGETPPGGMLHAVQGLLPLLLLLLLPLLSTLFARSPAPVGPAVRLDAPTPPHTLPRTSAKLHVPYWVNPAEVADYTPRQWRELDSVAERNHLGHLSAECEWEQSQRQRLANDATGFFFTDHAKLDRAKNYPMPSCKKLQGYGFRLPSY